MPSILLVNCAPQHIFNLPVTSSERERDVIIRDEGDRERERERERETS